MDKKILDLVADIHRRAFTVDAHFDLTYEVANRRERGQKKIIETSYLQEFRAGGLDLIVSALFIHNFFLPEMGLRRALDQISYLHEEIDESPGQCRLCRTTAEARAARAAGETGIFLSLEGADPLQNDLQLLRIFYELGVRGLCLVWSRRNYVGDVQIGGIAHVGIGFDLCDSFKDFLQVEKSLESHDVIKTHAGLGEFTAGLIRRGYSDEEIIAILGSNFMRVFSEILG